MHYLRGTTYKQLGFYHRRTILHFYRIDLEFPDEKGMVFLPFWPFGQLLKRIGGIPVERSKHTSMTDQLAQKAKESSHFSLAITPEGTRSLAKQWKRGFYFIALKAQLPILLYAIDYPNKRIVCTKTLHPSGNVDADMRIIMEYYRQFGGKHPEKFVVEEITQ